MTSATPLLVAVLFAAVCAAKLPNFPSIRYLGTGYDAFKGNPRPRTGLDPGFKNTPIFSYTFDPSGSNQAGGFALPTNVTGRANEQCSSVSEQLAVSSLRAYRQSLEVEVSMGGGLLFDIASYSANADFRERAASLHGSDNVIYTAKAQCHVFRAAIDPFGLPAFAPAFKAAVAQLSAAVGTASWTDTAMRFASEFGTHYAGDIKFGARYTMESTFDHTTYNHMLSANFTFNAAAGVSFLILNGGVSGVAHAAVQYANQFNQARSATRMSSIGVPPMYGDVWRASILTTAPVPIAYALTALTDLLTAEHFPQLRNIATVQQQLKSFYSTTWCPTVGGTCSAPPPPIGQYFANPENGAGGVTVQCPAGSNATGAGVSFETMPTANTVQVYADGQQAVSTGNAPHTVHAVCLALPTARSVVSKSILGANWTAPCRDGYVVSNCNSHIGAWNSTFKGFSSYPIDGGKQCLARAPTGIEYYADAQCVAESSVPGYEINSNIEGWVGCTEGKTLLGCGFQTQTASTGAQWSVYPDSTLNRCWGQSTELLIIYAMCADINTAPQA